LSVAVEVNAQMASELAPIIAQLKARRVELGLSQLATDALIGTCNGHVAKWESHDRRPTAFLLLCWASALGLILHLTPAQDQRSATAALAAASTERNRHGLTGIYSRPKRKHAAT
jgi:transcriptional regulator with XRE-family HTH domain